MRNYLLTNSGTLREVGQRLGANAKDSNLMGMAARQMLYAADDIEMLRTQINLDDIKIDELKSLCADMWRFTGAACEKYPRLFDPPAQGGQRVRNNLLEEFKHRMSALGIEVS